jgi:Uma2 family endonuclease
MAVQAVDKSQRVGMQEWLNLPEGPPYYELEAGRLVEMAAPTIRHQDIVMDLGTTLRQFCKAHEIGKTFAGVDVVLPIGKGYIPDIAFILKERLGQLIAPDEKIHGVPDLVVEVISPSTQKRDRVTKFQTYWEAGVPWYWLIDSETLAIQEFEHTSEGYLCRATVLPGKVFEPKLFPGLKIDLQALTGIEVTIEDEDDYGHEDRD